MSQVQITEFTIWSSPKENKTGSFILGQFAAKVGGILMKGCGFGHGPRGYFAVPPQLAAKGHIRIIDSDIRTELIERALFAYRAFGGTFEPDTSSNVIEAPEGYVAANLDDDQPATLEDLAGLLRTLSVEKEEAFRACA